MSRVDLVKLVRRVDFILILAVIALVCYGTLMVYSATYPQETQDPYYYLKRQITWVILGILVVVTISCLDYNWLRPYTIPIYILNIILLTSVFFVGRSTLGAQRWIPIGFFLFQPSEFAKAMLIITLSAFLASRRGEITSAKDLSLAFAHIALPLILIFKQPDLGTALVLAAILMGMLLVAGTSLRNYVIIIAIGVLICFLIIHFNLLKDYQMKRLIVYLNPDIDPLGAGYHLLQSKIAIGSGGFFGKGLFSGSQTNLRFVPAHHTDFIFAVIGEELGFLGAAILLGLYSVIIARGIRIATTARNLFGTLMAIGVVSMWLFQILVNVGMNLGIMPITGIPLPFISYGGSSMITNLIATGLLLNIYARRFK